MNRKVGTLVRAMGKINLYLNVTGREENGYHTIESVMQSVSLCDRVTVSAARGEGVIRIACNLPYVPCDERNIACKAARAFLEECGIFAEVHISIDKRIPVAGGMAGGSADAAAVLLGLNRIFDKPLDDGRLYAIAASLGADVPFCLAGGTALCTGYGDVISPLESSLSLPLLIVPSRENVSTPWAYAELDRAYGNFASPPAEDARLAALSRALETGNAEAVAENMYNIFEDVILPQREQAAQAKRLLDSAGALRAMMSGSGPTVFGLFENAAARDGAARILAKHGFRPKKAEIVRRKVQKPH